MKSQVYVITKANLFQPETFVDVCTTLKVAENYLRKNVSQYMKKDGPEEYHYKTETGKTILYFIRPVEVKEK